MQFRNINFLRNKFGIYAIKNKINNKIYIGQTSQPFIKRYWHHKWKLQNNQHDNYILQDDWNKYNEDDFIFYVIRITEDKSILDDLEIYYIKEYRVISFLYNMLQGGGGRRGYHMSEKTKRLIGEANRINMLGRKHTSETKIKMSKIRKGKYVQRKSDVITPQLAKTIKELLVVGNEASAISQKLNISYSIINNMISNNTWSHVKVNGWDEYLNSRKTYHRLTKQDHRDIYQLFLSGEYTKKELAVKYNRTPSMINYIIRKQQN